MTRTAVLWVPDWPVVAAMGVAGVDAHVPAAVLTSQGVVAASAVARAGGVRRGMRRRAAQEQCPGLVLLAADDARDAREFEPVAVAAETVVAGVEVARPGLLLLPADGAARYHGTEGELVRALVEAVAAAGFEGQAGLADGLLAAVLAARADAVVPPGRSADFLAPRPVVDLLHAACDPGVMAAVRAAVDLWWRLGVRTLGDLAGLPPASVSGRFGDLGVWAQRLARGEDLRPPARRRPEEDLAVAEDLDPPALRVDVATFAARRLAEALHDLLSRRGLACGRLRITARTEESELERVWRTDDAATGGLSAARITDRVRWQLEGWLTSASVRRGRSPVGRDGDASPAPIVHLRLAAEEVVPAGTHQPSLWGAGAGGGLRARRALGRVQGLLGGDAVLTAAVQGGRDPRDRIHLTPFGEQAAPARDATLPWPGALPAPAPATVPGSREHVRLLDAAGVDVVIDDRLSMPAPPATLIHPSRPAAALVGWAGPWVLDERWWEPGGRRRVLVQVVLDDGRGALLAFHGDDCGGDDCGGDDCGGDDCGGKDGGGGLGGWGVEAVYD